MSARIGGRKHGDDSRTRSAAGFEGLFLLGEKTSTNDPPAAGLFLLGVQGAGGATNKSTRFFSLAMMKT